MHTHGGSQLSAPRVPRPLLTPRPTSTTNGSSTWRASSWPTTRRPCPCWPTTPLRAGTPPGETPLPDRPPLQPRLPLRASLLNAELCPGGRPGPEPGLDTAVPRPHIPTEDRRLSLQALKLGPSAPEPHCLPSQAGPLAASGRAQPSSAPRAVQGLRLPAALALQVGPRRALQVQVQPPWGQARGRGQVVDPQAAWPLLPAAQPPGPEGLLHVPGVAVPRT